jgi:hypothetical protein
VKGVLAMQLCLRTFCQGMGFNLNCSWYLTIIMCQHVRAISKNKSYPNYQVKLSTCFHPLFPKWSTPGKGCWAPREYSGYSTVYSHNTCPINTSLWRQTVSEMLNMNGMIMQQITLVFIVYCVQASFKSEFHFVWHRGLSNGPQFCVLISAE